MQPVTSLDAPFLKKVYAMMKVLALIAIESLKMLNMRLLLKFTLIVFRLESLMISVTELKSLLLLVV